MTSPQEPESPEEYLKRLNEQYGQQPSENPYGSPASGNPYGAPPAASPYDAPAGQVPPPADQGQPGTPGYGQPQGYYGQPGGQEPYGYPGAPGYAVRPPTHSSATTALVLGLVSLVGAFLTCGLTLLAGPFAWMVGAKAVREIDASNGAYSGRDQANAGKIMGIISVVLLVLSLLAVVGFIAFVATSVEQSGGDWSQSLG